MKNFELVIAGGGLTAARAIKSYRESGGGGQIALLSKESDLPYHRPALSKRYLRGETADAPFAEDAAFYRDHDVEVLLDTNATAVSSVDQVKDICSGLEPLYTSACWPIGFGLWRELQLSLRFGSWGRLSRHTDSFCDAPRLQEGHRRGR